jgi:predicted RNase H-like nuclease
VSRLVVGVDGFKAAWLTVALEDGRFAEARVISTMAAVLEAYRDAEQIGVDVPIGLPDVGERREADVAARRFLGARRASVFFTPSWPVLAASTYAEARVIDPTLSAQSYRLGPKIREANVAAELDERIFEVHPEVSFRAMAGRELAYPKKTWNGLGQRLALLRRQGVELPDDLGEAGAAASDDVVDAAAAAWTADRAARGCAETLPTVPFPRTNGRSAAIWF